MAASIGLLVLATLACGTSSRSPGVTALSAPATGSAPSPAGTVTPRPGLSRLLRIDPVAGQVIDAIEVPKGSRMIAAAGGRVWLIDGTNRTLLRVEPQSDEIANVDVGEPAALTGDGDVVWASVDGNILVRIDGRTGEVLSKLVLGSEPLFALGDAGHLAVHDGTIWLTVPELGSPRATQTLWRVEARTGNVLDRIDIGVNPVAPVATTGFVWVVTRSGNGQLSRIDVGSGEWREIATASFPERLAAGLGAVWVGHVSRSLWQIDPATGSTMAKTDTGSPVRGVIVIGDEVWIATDDAVSRLDPETGAVTTVTDISAWTVASPQAWGLVEAGGSLWVPID